MEISNKIERLQGVIKHYEWGGKTFLPQLLHLENNDQKPYAEYWLGGLLEERFEKIPFLLKVQDVEKMLSIQVHPTKEVAIKKYKEENEKNIPLTAPHRNYKDENHKPELLSPLSEFYLLHGFKPATEITNTLESVPELQFLQPSFTNHDYKKLYTAVMTMPQEEVNKKLQPILDRIIPLYHSGKLNKSNPDFWAARAALTFHTGNNIDRGIFSIYLFNIVRMSEGDALFQDAGLPHAYLEGHTMEIMANSDNVLRGGLTPKHIDVKELLEHIRFEPTQPNVISSNLDHKKTGEQVFKTPAVDFELSKIVVRKDKGLAIPSIKTNIYFVYKGKVNAVSDEEEIYLESGNALIAKPGSVVHFASDEDAVIFRATEPIMQEGE